MKFLYRAVIGHIEWRRGVVNNGRRNCCRSRQLVMVGLARRAKVLAVLTLMWLGIEGTVGVVAGILARSIALVAFGLDSAIEGLASVIVIWRFSGDRTISADAEPRAQKWVAISFFCSPHMWRRKRSRP